MKSFARHDSSNFLEDGKTGWQLLDPNQQYLQDAIQRRASDKYGTAMHQEQLAQAMVGVDASVLALPSGKLLGWRVTSYEDMLSKAAQGSWMAARGPLFNNRFVADVFA